jgi:hypothetical protein
VSLHVSGHVQVAVERHRDVALLGRTYDVHDRTGEGVSSGRVISLAT